MNGLSESENIAYGWTRMFWSELIPSGLFLLLMFFIPKGPRWLALTGEDEKALAILNKIHGEEETLIEISKIKKFT